MQGEKGDKGDKGDAGEVTLEDLNTALIDKADVITDTASGSIASFSDGADDLPLKSLVVDINPIQDLHGQESPYPAGGGKNLLDPNKTVPSPTGAYGFTMERHGDVFRVYGTCTTSGGGAFAVITGYSNDSLSGKGYVVQAFNVTGGVTINNVYGFRTESERQIAIAITRTEGQYYDFSFNISVSAETQATYAPYENICPISGWTQAGVNQSGVNLWDEETESGTYSVITGAPRTESSKIRAKNDVPVLPNTTYYKKTPKGFWNIYLDADKNVISYGDAGQGVFTTPNNCYYIRFSLEAAYGTTYNHDISINYPSTDHDYHPYTGRSITIDLGQTVYGGHLDVLSGVLTVDMANISITDYLTSIQNNGVRNSNQLIFLPVTGKKPGTDNFISNLFFISSSAVGKYTMHGRAATTSVEFEIPFSALGVTETDPINVRLSAAKQWLKDNPTQLCYELATPITIQLTSNQVNSLLGVNNLWADTGDTTAEYRADTKLYISKKIAEAIASLT